MKNIVLLVFASITSIISFAQRYSAKNYLSSQEKLNNEYCSELFRTHDGIIFDLQNGNESAKAYSNVLEWLQGRVAGLQIYYTRSGTPIPFIRNTRASVFVDEIQVDAGFLNSLPTTDIAMIKVIKGPFVGAVGNGGGGSIAVYTVKGEDEDDNGE
jgi:hypothetical protein